MDPLRVAHPAPDAVCALRHGLPPHHHRVVRLHDDVEGLVARVPGVLLRHLPRHRGRVQQRGQPLGEARRGAQLQGRARGGGGVGGDGRGAVAEPEIEPPLSEPLHHVLTAATRGATLSTLGTVNLRSMDRCGFLPTPPDTAAAASDPAEVRHVQRHDHIVPGSSRHEPSLGPLPLEQPAVVTSALVDHNLVGPGDEKQSCNSKLCKRYPTLPQVSLAADRTRHGAPVTLVHVVPAGAGGVEAVDDVAGVDVREPLGGQDLEVDTARSSQVIL